jgi:xanthine dehydrogenase YagT iron-sulfur-binding subunit
MRDNPRSSSSDLTRRAFLQTTGGTAAAAVIAGYSTFGQSASPAEIADGPNIEGAVPITLRINGKDRQLRVDPRTTLLDCIRETVALTGTKKGCDHGQCGACTVHVNGRRVNSCLSLALMHDGEEIGIGEIGLAGIAAAITAAVHHATGVRVRELPVKIENLLA